MRKRWTKAHTLYRNTEHAVHCVEENPSHWQLRRNGVVSLTLIFTGHRGRAGVSQRQSQMRLLRWQKLERKWMNFGFSRLQSEFWLNYLKLCKHKQICSALQVLVSPAPNGENNIHFIGNLGRMNKIAYEILWHILDTQIVSITLSYITWNSDNHLWSARFSIPCGFT